MKFKKRVTTFPFKSKRRQKQSLKLICFCQIKKICIYLQFTLIIAALTVGFKGRSIRLITKEGPLKREEQ